MAIFIKKINNQYLQKNTLTAFFKRWGLLFSLLTILCNYSQINYSLGSIFFGKYKNLYNVNLANFFFWQAVHTPIEKPVPYANHQLSRTYFIKGNLPDALLYAKQELSLYPENTATYYILGLTYGYMDMNERAINAFSSYITTHPDTWAARNDKAWLQFKIGDIDSALKTLEPFEDATGNPWIQNTLGTLYLNKKNYPLAKEHYLNALQAASSMSDSSWGAAYPGNDPRIYDTGKKSMIFSIKKNLLILEQKTNI